jgi:hypothetical protein
MADVNGTERDARFREIKKQLILVICAMLLGFLASYTITHSAAQSPGPGGIRKALERETLASDAQSISLLNYTSVLVGGMLLFGLVVTSLEVYITVKSGRYWDNLSVKLIGVTIISVLACVVVLSGYGESQITAVVGILGAALGYLAGKDFDGETPVKRGAGAKPVRKVQDTEGVSAKELLSPKG